MRRVSGILAVVLVCSALLLAESVRSLYKKGVQAEARQDYETAYEYFKQAYAQKPEDLKYRVPFERLRFLAAASKIHRAQKLRDEGKLQEALALFVQAAQIDSSNDLAVQEIRRTQQMMQKQPASSGGNAPSSGPSKEEEDPLRKRLEESRSPIQLKDVATGTLSALEMTEDSKVIYETVGKLAGLNILFDPDYQSRRLPIKLQKVTLQEALDIVALESRTFWRPVTPNTIFVAQDTTAKRRELEQNVIKTFYLGNVSAATDLQDIVNTIRTVLEVPRIQQVPSQNAIVIKGTPDQLAMAEKLVNDIDRAKPEMIVDIVVARVNRDKVRTMGILPPQNASVALQGTGASTTPAGGGAASSPGFSFKDLEHLKEGNFAVTVDPVKAQLLFSDGDTKILQSPRIRASDNEKATLKIVDRIPIVSGSFGTPTGVAGATGAVGVNTQFTYTDVGVIMEITPHVHPDGQISLKTSLEVSNVSNNSTTGGVTQPIISQDKIEQTIRLNDGEINLLGGIMERLDSKTTGGTPLLGSIPFLKYLFSQETKHVNTNEIIFLMVPHIVRRQELTELNRRAFDVGTGATIELHMAAKPAPHAENAPPPATAGSAAASPQQLAQSAVAPPVVQPSSSAVAPSESASQPAGAAAAGGQVSLRLDPMAVAPPQGSNFALSVLLAHGQDISTVSVEIAYDPKIMQFVSVTQGDFLAKDGQPVTPVHRDDPSSGRLRISAQRAPGAAGVSGDGTVFNLMFLAKTKGAGVVSIAVPGARNSQNQQLVVLGSQASVTVN